MKNRYIIFGLIIILSYILMPKKIARTTINPTNQSPSLPNQSDLVPITKLKEIPVKPLDPVKELSHEEFIARERKYAEEKLQSLVLGWCIASKEEVRNYFTETYSTMPKSYRQEILNPNHLCLNEKEIASGKEWKCFTYQALCPSQFQETDDVTLLSFFSGQEVYRYERRVMDYKTYVQNPDLPAFPGTNYWAGRANDIKILAEQIRGEPVEGQNWGVFNDAEKLGD